MSLDYGNSNVVEARQLHESRPAEIGAGAPEPVFAGLAGGSLSPDQLVSLEKLVLVDSSKMIERIDWNEVAASCLAEPIGAVDHKPSDNS